MAACCTSGLGFADPLRCDAVRPHAPAAEDFGAPCNTVAVARANGILKRLVAECECGEDPGQAGLLEMTCRIRMSPRNH